jgi:hypothetical protein
MEFYEPHAVYEVATDGPNRGCEQRGRNINIVPDCLDPELDAQCLMKP